MERMAIVDGLTLAHLLERVEAGAQLILTRDGREVAAIVRPADLSDAAIARLLEGMTQYDAR